MYSCLTVVDPVSLCGVLSSLEETVSITIFFFFFFLTCNYLWLLLLLILPVLSGKPTKIWYRKSEGPVSDVKYRLRLIGQILVAQMVRAAARDNQASPKQIKGRAACSLLTSSLFTIWIVRLMSGTDSRVKLKWKKKRKLVLFFFFFFDNFALSFFLFITLASLTSLIWE